MNVSIDNSNVDLMAWIGFFLFLILAITIKHIARDEPNDMAAVLTPWRTLAEASYFAAVMFFCAIGVGIFGGLIIRNAATGQTDMLQFIQSGQSKLASIALTVMIVQYALMGFGMFLVMRWLKPIIFDRTAEDSSTAMTGEVKTEKKLV